MREPLVLEPAPPVPDPLATVVTDEALVPAHELPDPLRFENGEPVPADGWLRRRAELLALFEDHVYGRIPDAAVRLDATTREAGPAAGLAAIRHQVRLTIATERGELPIDLLLVLPESPWPAPVFLVPNFDGNHTVGLDPAVEVSAGARRDRGDDVAPRGSKAHRFPLRTIVARGHGLATFYAADADADADDGFAHGAHRLFGDPAELTADGWGTIGAWAWACSRVLDHLLTRPDVDAGRVTIGGHSRLGKTALWAAARDERFAAVFSNDSGCTGAALSRRRFGENVAVINALFPHWFCRNYRHYATREDRLPIDQHQLLALAAPRPVHVGSAADDLWADPVGERLATEAARPAFELVGGSVTHHVRPGGHDLLAEDWTRYLDLADELGTISTRCDGGADAG